MKDSKPTLTVEETAKLLRISRGLAFQAVARGDIPSIASAGESSSLLPGCMPCLREGP